MYESIVIFTVTLGMLILMNTFIYILLRVSRIEVWWYFNLIDGIVGMLKLAVQPLTKFYYKHDNKNPCHNHKYDSHNHTNQRDSIGVINNHFSSSDSTSYKPSKVSKNFNCCSGIPIKLDNTENKRTKAQYKTEQAHNIIWNKQKGKEQNTSYNQEVFNIIYIHVLKTSKSIVKRIISGKQPNANKTDIKSNRRMGRKGIRL